MITPSSNSKNVIHIYWHQAWKYPRLAFGALLSIPVTILVSGFLPPLIIAHVFGLLSIQKGGQNIHTYIPWLFGYALVSFSGVLCWRLIDSFTWRLEGHVTQDLARRIYAHLLGQSANFHANSFSGSLVSQSNKFIGAYVRIADTTIYQVLPLIWSLIFTAVILSRRAPLFVASFLVFAVIYMILATKITRKGRVLSAHHAVAETRQTGYLADSVTNVMAIKSFAGSSYEEQQYKKYTNKTRLKLMSLMKAMQRQMLYFSGMSRVVQILALATAVVSVINFRANVATVFLVVTYTSQIAEQLFTFGNNSLRNYNRSFGDASEMASILHIEPEIKDPLVPEKVNISDGKISFHDVTFQHDGAVRPIFSYLNLDIKPGEKIGLVGHSGSGKTTMTRLLLRFSDVQSGAITIDDQNISHITQDDLHAKIAYVPQEPIMFHRSLRDNIRYGQFDATDDMVKKAANVAHAAEFIDELPDGYDTLVGERGVKLSGGQRQRVAIARAMLKNAPILVLDEATSALDSESEALIQDALWKLMQGRTAIVIAHRLSTIQKMDRIIVLDNGAIVEQGTHKELLARKGIYASLWTHQSGGFITE